MATGKQAEKKKSNGDGISTEIPAPPPGFQKVNITGQQVWWKRQEGATMLGVLLGRYGKKGKNKDQHYYQFRLLQPSLATRGASDEREDVSLMIGDIISVDESAALSDLAPLSEDVKRGAEIEVWIGCGAKIKLPDGSGKTFWPLEIHQRTVKRASADGVTGIT